MIRSKLVINRVKLRFMVSTDKLSCFSRWMWKRPLKVSNLTWFCHVQHSEYRTQEDAEQGALLCDEKAISSSSDATALRSPRRIWTQVRSHTWFLQNELCSQDWGSRGVNKTECFSPPGVKCKQCRCTPVRVRDLAIGRLLNGREQTAGAGEQTEQPHQKAEGVNRGWTTDDEVRQSGHFPKLKSSG